VRCTSVDIPLAPPLAHTSGGGGGGGSGGPSVLRLRVEIMGSQKRRIAGNSQSDLIMIYPIIFTRTRTASNY
jgi:hypothetical protein